MLRLLPVSLAALACLLIGCGGAGGGLFATVPPPVEFVSGIVPGLAELPATGTYRGDLSVESVTMTNVPRTGWTQTSATPVSSARAGATVGERGSIVLRQDGETNKLFQGSLNVVPAKPGTPTSTDAVLTCFDGNQEKFRYVLREGSPRTLQIVARGKVRIEGEQATFDRYTFVLRP